MPSQNTEYAFESYVESVLLDRSGWERGSLDEWNRETAIFEPSVLSFVRETQPKLWDELKALQGAGTEALVIRSLVKELDLKGTLHVLRHGFKIHGKLARLAYFKPAHGLNPDSLALFAKNRLTVTRQVPCHVKDNGTIDLVFALNGLPTATCELKNPGTGQTWRDAEEQYRKDRDPAAPLFKWKTRAVVHFAADTEEIRMTTELAKGATYFLPFNRGDHPGEIRCGAGNPAHPSGHRTGYFWEETLERESFLDILGHFLFIERKQEKVVGPNGKSSMEDRERIVFPRYHQIDAVRKLVSAARTEGVGHHYLIQHSAGSGKTNSISWLSHRLASLHTDKDEKVYDCVLVITDRRVLDQQLQDAIYQIEHSQGVVQRIDENAKQLAEALVDGTKIVITTLQKFPFVMKGLMTKAEREKTDEAGKSVDAWANQIGSRKYAIIVDEAHSSQSGESARELKGLLGAKGRAAEGEEPADYEEVIGQVIENQGPQPNLSFFAFTATPKGKTIEQFGRLGSTGKPEAFHVYSMRQAIEEGFILDVLTHYTTYETYFRLLKAAEDDPELPKRKAARKLAQFMSLHPHNVEQKTAVMVEHFRAHVRHHLGGRAKAMVVTSSRLHAVRYMEAFQRYIKEKGYSDIRPLVAFSGTVKDPDTDLEYTEPGMNIDIVSGRPIGESQLPERFESPDYQVLLVANKYQTGFDQPLLQAMYVDKRLDGVQAVQTLSRLNRKIRGKSEPFVLDFVNTTEDVFKAFKPYYDTTVIQEVSDPHKLDQLKHELDQAQIYHWSEVEAFARIFYRPARLQSAADNPRMRKHLDPAIDRFNGLGDPKDREEFRDKLSIYVKTYAFLSQILPYFDPDLEKLYVFGRFLLRLLVVDRAGARVDLGDEVALEYYRLERTSSGRIDLNEGEDPGVKSPTAVGTGTADEKHAPLSEIIKTLNDRFGTEFAEEDRLFFQHVAATALKTPHVANTVKANTFEKVLLGIRKPIEHLVVQQLGNYDRIVTRYMDDPEFQNTVFTMVAREIYDAIHNDHPTA